MVCEETEGEFSWFAPLVWWSDWALVTSTATWFVWVWQTFIKKNTNGQGPSLILIELSLPLSIFAMIGYTVYLGTGNWGDDLVDNEACHTLTDSAIPKQGNEPSNLDNLYLASAFITIICIHYICPVSNVVLYFKYYARKKPWKPFRPIGFISIISMIVILVQAIGEQVIYCTNNIYIVSLVAIVMCTVIHALFFYRLKENDKEESLDADSEKADSTELSPI